MAFKIHSNKYINKDREITVNEKVNGNVNICVIKKMLLVIGMNDIKLTLKDNNLGNFGKEFIIKVAVEDEDIFFFLEQFLNNNIIL